MADGKDISPVQASDQEKFHETPPFAEQPAVFDNIVTSKDEIRHDGPISTHSNFETPNENSRRPFKNTENAAEADVLQRGENDWKQRWESTNATRSRLDQRCSELLLEVSDLNEKLRVANNEILSLREDKKHLYEEIQELEGVNEEMQGRARRLECQGILESSGAREGTQEDVQGLREEHGRFKKEREALKLALKGILAD
ncbi:MAG: hypothetical protein Q9227_006029 [Pyrenula ochraceoflavens]